MKKNKQDKRSFAQSVKGYNAALRQANSKGYRDGYAAYDEIPKVWGARSMAKYGYGKGMSAHKRVNAYQRKARKQ